MVLVYITRLIPYLNPNPKSFTIETLVYLLEMRLEWLDISWVFTETYWCGNFFKPLYNILNSSVFLIILNLPKQLNTFMIISHEEGAMYFSIFFFLFLEFLAWQIVILQEWTNFITIWEWPISALRGKIRYLLSDSVPWYIFIIQYMEHVWWLNWWRRLDIKWLYLVFRKYLFCRINLLEWKGETHQY